MVLLDGLKKLEDVNSEVFRIEKRNKAEGAKLAELSADADFVIVPAFRHKDVRWVKKFATAPVVFDPLISTYLTKVIDYGHYHKAVFKYISDFRSLRAADYLLADTFEMKKYYQRFFCIPEHKIGVVPVGYISDHFVPAGNKVEFEELVVGFYGSFVPLQGTDIIAEAARILKDEPVRFEIIGSGARYSQFRQKIEKHGLNNIHLNGWLPYEKLAAKLQEFDIALGIFGRSGKAARVIPNKLFHYAALQKCVISRRSPAIPEIFDDRDMISIETNGQELASAIMTLKNDRQKRSSLAMSAYEKISSEYNEIAIARRLVSFLSTVRQA